ncbi:MAG: hypothetical protein FD157_420 [Rhodocyclaceae bacterium]|nr:MAG: hypothetical protein FD157_420 [Rhodocyclaceae bacterium]TND00539.1 MAG: hypothetical protein FD118_3023 [Rhodocyclaceae bacterium]
MRPANQALNEDMVVQVRGLTDKLSGVVESLPADHVEPERRQRLAKSATVAATVSLWNAFNARHRSFADEYSSL